MAENILKLDDVKINGPNTDFSLNNGENIVDPEEIDEDKLKRKRRKQIKNRINEVRPFPKKLLGLSICLLMIGSVLLGVGLGDYDQSNFDRSISLIVFGSILFIPGFFYSYQIYRVLMTRDPAERNEILEDMPEFEDE